MNCCYRTDRTENSKFGNYRKRIFTIPVSYFMKGGDSDADGLLVSSTNKNGKTTTEFVSPTIYYTTDDYYYIDSENVTAGDILVKPDSNETYRVGSDTATLKKVSITSIKVMLFSNRSISFIRARSIPS